MYYKNIIFLFLCIFTVLPLFSQEENNWNEYKVQNISRFSILMERNDFLFINALNEDQPSDITLKILSDNDSIIQEMILEFEYKENNFLIKVMINEEGFPVYELVENYYRSAFHSPVVTIGNINGYFSMFAVDDSIAAFYLYNDRRGYKPVNENDKNIVWEDLYIIIEFLWPIQ